MALASTFYKGVVTDAARAANRAGAPDYGVYGEDDFKVSTHPSIPYALVVKKGKAHGHGVTDVAVADETVQCTSLSTGVRWDLIVIRRNWQPMGGGTSTLVAIPGGAFTDIPAGRKNNPGVEDDQPIAFAMWEGAQNTPKLIIDLRCWANNQGMEIVSEIAFEYLGKPGAAVRFDGLTWRYTRQANSTWGWGPDGLVETFSPLPASGYSVTGEVVVDSSGSRNHATVDLTIKRTGGPMTITTTYAGFGAIIPSSARGGSFVKYMPVVISGGGPSTVIQATVALNTLDGTLLIKANSGSFSWVTGAQMTLLLSYYL